MKWIGQSIWDQIARFRNDVYLESISTGTIASGAHLGLDSNNKIVKAVDGGGDLTSIVAGTGLSGTSLTGPIPTINIDAAQPTITSLGTTGASGSGLWDNFNFGSNVSDKPVVSITNFTNDATAGMLNLFSYRENGGVQDAQNNDYLGTIQFSGYDDGTPSYQVYANIESYIVDATSDEEKGSLGFKVANYQGGLSTGLLISGGATDRRVDVTIASGAASVTTVAGTLTMGSTAFVNNSGVVQVATQGTIDHDSLANFVTAEHVDWAGASAGTIHSTNIPTLNQNTTGTAATVTGAAQASITTLAGLTSLGAAGATTDIAAGDLTMYNAVNDGAPTISIGSSATERLEITANYASGTQQVNQAIFKTYTASGTSNRGRFIFSADETTILQIWDAGLNLSENMALQINGTAIISDSSGTATLSNIDALDATTEATIEAAMDTLPNVTSLGTLTGLTVEGDLTVNGDTVTFQSANADDPVVTIKNTSSGTDDMARLNFVKDRGTAPAVGDNLAEIRFFGEDSGQNEQEYGRIFCETDVVTSGQESGKLSLGVANHDGGNGYGLILTGGSANDEVDVTVGLGAASTTTVAGNLIVNSNVGIGTSSPEAQLHLESTGDTALIIRADNDNSGENDNPLIHLQQDFVASGSSGVMADSKIGIAGDVGGIFTNSLSNATYISSQVSTSSGGVETGTIQFATGGNNGQDTDVAAVLPTARMTIIEDGKIGIGTNAPAEALDVVGDIKLSGDIELGHASDTTIARSAAGVATIEGNQIVTAGVPKGNTFHVGCPTYISLYVFYMNIQNYWYTPPMYNTQISTNTAIGSMGNLAVATQARAANYVAPRACKVKTVSMVFKQASSYLSGDINLEFQLIKWTPNDDASGSVAVTDMAITDHAGGFTENDVHSLIFTVTDNADAALAANDCLAFCARTTSAPGSGSTVRNLVNGHINYEIEIT